MYQKNREVDDTSAWGRIGTPGSGSQTPIPSIRQRAGGSLSVQVQEPKGKRIDQGGEGRRGQEKDREKIWDLPKSKAVKRLEGIQSDLKTLQAGEGKLSTEKLLPDCFCQGWYSADLTSEGADSCSSYPSVVCVYAALCPLRTHHLQPPSSAPPMPLLS